MTKEEFNESIAQYLAFYEKNPNADQMRLWFRSCGHLSVDQFESAFNQHIKTSIDRWFPVPGQILELVEHKERAFKDTDEGKKLFESMEVQNGG